MASVRTPPGSSDSAREITRALRPRTSELVEQVAEHIRREIPSYADGSVVSVGELRSSVTSNVNYILRGLEGSDTDDLGAPIATGRARAAHGAPLVDLLTAYRVAFADIWNAVAAEARSLRAVSADAMAELAGLMFTLQNEYCDAVINAYRDEAHQLTRSSERERAVLVELIVSETAPRGSLWEAAQTLRLPLQGTFLVVAAEAHELGHDPLPRAESALAVLDVRSIWRLEADLSVGVLSLPDRTRLDGVLAVLRRHATARVGVSPVFIELRDAAWALRLARLALPASKEKTGVNQFEDSPLTVLVAAAPQVALDTARAVLGTLLDLPADDRDLLLSTFQAWLRAGGSAAAAASLFCHPNTIRYRLRRIEAETGRSLNNPGDVAELVTAIHAWCQLPHQI